MGYKSNFFILIVLILSCLSSASGQAILPDSLKYGWAGGLNSPQFVAMDLNLDGLNDLLVFDRHGNRKLTFIYQGTPNTIDYAFYPEYALKLPELHDWVITADYNRDGKEDIFTYSNGGIRVFKNISDTSLRFELVTDLLKSYYYTGYIGILLTPVDYPAIADIDGDGDLDILSFFGLGSFVEYHKNLSMEKYGHCDSLDYKLSDHCWGKFRESESGNRITLNVDCPYDEPMKPRGTRHTGSTMLAIDLNGDGLKDLLVGDIDYPNLFALINGGTKDSAFMISLDTLFPSNSRKLSLFSFPSAQFIDLDHDGDKDLIVSPFDPGLFVSQNYHSVWLYKNTGSNEQPVFEFRTERLFQENMLDFGSAAYPLLYDLNGDGLQDLIVGNEGYYDTSYYEFGMLHSDFISKLTYYQNTGSVSEPFFQWITDDLAGLSAYQRHAFYPGIGDLNGDQQPDLLLGMEDGSLVFLPNTGYKDKTPSFGPPQWNYKQIDVGDYSTPQVFDLDRDGLPDLILGERNGNLNYYRNTGSLTNPVFTLITDSLGKVNVTNYAVSYDGYSTPYFFRDQEQHTLLIVGCEEGKIHFYNNVDAHLQDRFTASDSLFSLIGISYNSFCDGWRSSASLSHLSDPSYFDLITGNFSGGLRYFSKKIHPGVNDQERTNKNSLLVYPNPADHQIVISSSTPVIGSSAKLYTCQIYNSFGQTVFNQKIDLPARITTTGFPQGLYLIRLENFLWKLIIRH